MPHVWKWIFNVADIFVTVGAVLLGILYIIREIKMKKAAKPPKDGTEAPEKKNDV
jgi:lipoprotein signal peptidase